MDLTLPSLSIKVFEFEFEFPPMVCSLLKENRSEEALRALSVGMEF